MTTPTTSPSAQPVAPTQPAPSQPSSLLWSYRWLCWMCLVLAFLVVTAGATVRASGSGMGCPDWPKCFGYLIPPTNDAQVRWAPKKAVAKGTMIINPLASDDGLVVDRLLVANGDFVTTNTFDPARWTTFDRHDYAIFNPTHTWVEFINRLLGALIAFPVLALLAVGVTMGLRRQGWGPAVWSAVVVVQLGIVGWLGREVVLGNLTPNSITVHMLAAFGLIAFMLGAYAHGRPRPASPLALRLLVFSCWLIVLLQIAIGTQVREAIDALNRGGTPRTFWLTSLPEIFLWHRLLSWVVTACVLAWFAYLWWRKQAGPAAWISIGLLAMQVLSGVVLAHFYFPAILQPVHLLAAMLLAGILWWSLIYGPRPPSIPSSTE